MKKEKITRQMLQSDFLRQTIIRIDYDYLFDDYIEEVMQNLDTYLGAQGFSIKKDMLARFGFSVDLERIRQDENSNILDNINVDDDKRESFSSFINDEKNIKIDITREYSSITVNYKTHIHFDQIRAIFAKIVEELKKVRVHLFIRRIGLRKVNIYVIEDLKKINDFFENNIFSLNCSSVEQSNLLGRNCLETYSYDKYLVNEITNVSQGILSSNNIEKEVYQLAIDFDIYVENVDDEEIDLEDMNNKIFELYKKDLKESFLNSLTKKDFNEEGLYKL